MAKIDLVLKDGGAEKRAVKGTLVHGRVDMGSGSSLAVVTEPEFDTATSSGQ